MQVKLIVPRTFNDKTPILPTTIHLIETKILETAGGFTRTCGHGVWRNAKGVRIDDEVLIYSIYLPDSLSFYRFTMGEIAKFIGTVCKQESVYLEIDGKVFYVKP